MSFNVRIVTKKMEIVKVEPVAYDSDGFAVCFVDEQGILHFTASYLCDLLKKQHDIINICVSEEISDSDLLKSIESLLEEFSE